MRKTGSRRSPALLAAAGAAVSVPVALGLAGCASGPHAAAGPAPSGAAQRSLPVPRYVAADNARSQVAAGPCRPDGTRGWQLAGTVRNPAPAARGYSIVVDFVTARGDTVLATRVTDVGPVAPGRLARWSVTGAAGQSDVTCVIRQALVRA
jgi:hypothetical protein